MIAEAVRHMLAAGMTHEAVVAAVEDMERTLVVVPDPVAERRRAYDRHRKATKREEEKSGGSPVESAESAAPPSLDKESFPQTPFKEINPNPVHIRARKGSGFPAPQGVSEPSWQAFCSQRKKRLTQIAYDRILGTLEAGKRAGWPPGEMIDKAIERGWETVFVPKDERNGQRNEKSASGHGVTVDAAIDFVAGR